MVNFNFFDGTINTSFNFLIESEINFEFDTLAPSKLVYDFDFSPLSHNVFILRSSDNLFKSIWCDPDASLTSGRFFIASDKDLIVLNYRDEIPYVENYFSKTVAGSNNEVLDSEDMVDINVTV